LNRRLLASLIVGFVLLSAGVSAPARADVVTASGFNIVSATWGSSGNLIEAGPGSQDVPLVVTAQYYFNNAATGMVATLTLPPGFTDVNGGSGPSSYISGTVPSGAVVQFTFYLDVSPATSVGTFTFPVTFQWGAQTSSQSISVFQSTTFAVHLDGKVKLNFHVQPTSVIPGQVNDIQVTLTNNGSGTASQVSTAVSSPQLLSVLNTIPDMNTLGPNSSQTDRLEVYAPSTSAGTPAVLTFTSTYNDAYGTARSLSVEVGLFVEPLPTTSPVEIDVVPSYLQAGRVNNLTVTLTDVGTAPIEGLSATFSFVGGSATWLLPDIVQAQSLDPGGTVVVHAQAYDPPTTAGSSTLQGILRYSFNNVTVQESRNIGLLSRGLISIELTGVTVLPQAVAPGEIVSITLTITNVGIIAASAVTAQAQMPPGFQAIGSSSNFVGDMQVDSPSTFTLSALVSNSTAPGTYRVPVTLSYFDNLRTPLSQTVNATVVVTNSSNGGTGSGQTTTAAGGRGGISPLVYVAIIVVVVVIALLYLRRRRSGSTATR